MNEESVEIGIQIAQPIEAPSTPVAPVTLQDLLLEIRKQERSDKAMLASTVGKFTEFWGQSADNISIDLLEQQMEPFLQYLRSGKYKPNSVKSYRNFVNILLRSARASGWSALPFDVPAAWQPLWESTRCVRTKEIIRFAVQLGRKPKEFSEDDLTTWRLNRAKTGYRFSGTGATCSAFRIAVVKAGLKLSLPLIKFSKPPYGVSLAKMNPQLSSEIKELAAWKMRGFEPDRPANARIRPVSAKNLTNHLCRIVGYVQNELAHPQITSLGELVTPTLIKGYASWAINDREIQGDSLAAGLTALRTAMEQNPKYRNLNLEWLGHLAKQAPTEPQSAVDGRKAKKFVSFDEADRIPSSIRAERMRHRYRIDPRACANSVRDELLMSWLLILPWRQKNIRECRILGDNPNLAKETIAPLSQMKKSNWIVEQEKRQPKSLYWQFHFSKEETKTKKPVHAFLPFDLIALLEEYLSKHRAVLIGEKEDPGTLFLGDRGGAFEEEQLTNHVKDLVALHAGKATTPHLFRDIVADDWLEHHPEDYLTVSKILWHRNIETTLKKYASRFDESAGVARMDDWRAGRRKAIA
jgi:integrase